MADAIAYKEAEIQLKVVRCGCGNPSSHPNAICSTPRSETDLGTVAFISNSPWKQLLWRLYGLPASIRRIQKINQG